MLAEQYSRPTESVKLPAGTLGRLPMDFGPWVGRDVALDESIIRITDTDDHVNRVYKRQGSSELVSLCIGYGIRFRDLVPHRPEVCYPDNGWTMEDSTTIEVETTRGTLVKCQLHQFQRGGALSSERVSVLNYYFVDGQYCPDVSLLRSKAFRNEAGPHFAVQVLITSSGARGWDSSDQAVKAFVAEVGPRIESILLDAINSVTNAAQDPVVSSQNPAVDSTVTSPPTSGA